MNFEEKFLKIISKAEANGFSFRDNSHIDNLEYITMGRFKMNITIQQESENNEVIEEKTTFTFNVTEVFFNHNFAKTFFGTHEVCSNCGHTLKGSDWKEQECSECKTNIINGEFIPIESWQYYLKKLVLEEDLMEYLIKYVG